jgi:CheY-like chemotaxis protein
MSKHLAEMMGGRAEARGECGDGSVFTVLLPFATGDKSNVAAGQKLSRFVTDGSVNVLVVDDNPINLKVAAACLARHNINADLAQGGHEALGKLREKRYHMLFIDHMMPGMDGLEAAARIRAEAGWRRSVPIVALSANAAPGAREMFLDSGMDDFLPKPIDACALGSMLRKWLPGSSIVETGARAAAKPKILIVDDEKGRLLELHKILSAEYSVLMAKSGPLALKLAESEKPQAIIMRAALSGMDGLSVLKQLKANPSTCGIHVVFTGAAGGGGAGPEPGAAGWLTAPFNRQAVMSSLRGLL